MGTAWAGITKTGSNAVHFTPNDSDFWTKLINGIPSMKSWPLHGIFLLALITSQTFGAESDKTINQLVEDGSD